MVVGVGDVVGEAGRVVVDVTVLTSGFGVTRQHGPGRRRSRSCRRGQGGRADAAGDVGLAGSSRLPRTLSTIVPRPGWALSAEPVLVTVIV